MVNKPIGGTPRQGAQGGPTPSHMSCCPSCALPRDSCPCRLALSRGRRAWIPGNRMTCRDRMDNIRWYKMIYIYVCILYIFIILGYHSMFWVGLGLAFYRTDCLRVDFHYIYIFVYYALYIYLHYFLHCSINDIIIHYYMYILYIMHIICTYIILH